MTDETAHQGQPLEGSETAPALQDRISAPSQDAEPDYQDLYPPHHVFPGCLHGALSDELEADRHRIVTTVLASLVEGICPRCREHRIGNRLSVGHSRVTECACLKICSNCQHHENLYGVVELRRWPLEEVDDEVYSAFHDERILVFYLDQDQRLVSPPGKFIGEAPTTGPWPNYIEVP